MQTQAQNLVGEWVSSSGVTLSSNRVASWASSQGPTLTGDGNGPTVPSGVLFANYAYLSHSLSINSRAFTLLIDIEIPATAAQAVLLGTYTNHLNFYLENGSWMIYDGSIRPLGQSPQAGRYTLGLSCGSAGVILQQGQSQTNHAALNPATQSGGWIGRFVNGSYLSCTIHRMAVWNTGLSASDLAAARDEWAGTQPPPPPPPTRSLIVCDGDSLTVGYGLDPSQAWPQLLGYDVTSFAQNSRILSAIAAESSQLTAAYDATRDANYLIVWAGTNDVSFAGRTPQQAAADMVTACNSAAAWDKVIACTAIPREPGYQPSIDAFNAALLAVQSPPWDVLCRLDQIQGLTYQADQIHLDEAGQQLVANAIRDAIDATQPCDCTSTLEALRSQLHADIDARIDAAIGGG